MGTASGTGTDTPVSARNAGSPTIDGVGLGTETLVQRSVAETTPLTASFSGVPASHDGSAFSFWLDLSEEIAGLSYQTLRDSAFTVTHGAVMKAARRAPPSNQSWNITIDPEAGESVEIVLPATTDCAATGAICTPSGRMLANRTSATVAPPNTGGQTGRTSATVQFQETAIDPGSERSVTITLNQTGTIPDLASVDVALSGNAVLRLECIGRRCGKLTYNSWAGTYTVPLSQGASTTFRAVMDRPLPREASSTLTLSSSGVSIGTRGVLTVSTTTASVIVPRACEAVYEGTHNHSFELASEGGTFSYYIRFLLQSGCSGDGTGRWSVETTASWLELTNGGYSAGEAHSGHPCTGGDCRRFAFRVQPYTSTLENRTAQARVVFGVFRRICG